MDDWAFLLESTLKAWRAAGEPRRIVAAVSGGADSVALLLILAEIARQEEITLTAAHVDHGLRKDSGEDAAFVQRLCEENGVPCRVFQVNIDGKSEDAARSARYNALLSGFPDQPDFFLALAHHQRDQAETVLMHLFRGSGGAGLAGMAERSLRPRPSGVVTLWRPFLTVSPDAIRRALAEKGVPWREDPTNAQDQYLRNYIRHHVLPAVRTRLPEAEAAMGRAAMILAEEDDYFRREADRFLHADQHACLIDPFRWVQCESLDELHPALRRHVLRRACPVALDQTQTEALCRLRPGETVNLPLGWRGQRTREKLFFLPPAEKAFAPMTSPALHAVPYENDPGDGKRAQALSRAVYARCTLRAWQTGDRIHPLGAKGGKSMQDYFVDKKIPAPFRPYMPLLCMGNRVVWAVGIGPGEEARVHPGDDAVLLTYEGFLPGDPSG